MNYKKIYDQLIEKRRKFPLIKKQKIDKDYQYCETHHIIPKCFNGGNSKNNLINLTAREHYIAHKLLEKIYKEEYGENSKEHEKMICALWRFIYSNETNSIINAKEYEKLKIKFSKVQSVRVSGSRNGMYGRKGKDSPVYGISPFKNFSEERMNEYKLKQSISHKGKPAWNKGKHIHYNYTDEQQKRMSERSAGKNNPMYGHSVTEYMTDEKIKEWKKHLSEAGKQRKPASVETRKKLSESNKGKKRTSEQKKHISEKHWKATGYKHMYNSNTYEQRLVNPNDFQTFLNNGFIFGQIRKNK